MRLDDKTAEYAQRVTDALVAAIEAGAGDGWQMPWHRVAPDALAPRNAATGAEYTGGNAWALWVMGATVGAPSPHWATYRQWESIGAQVRKGEHAIARVLRPMSRKIEDKATGDTIVRTVGFTSHAVFHAGQVDGWTAPVIAPPAPRELTEEQDIEAAYSFVRRAGARLNLAPSGGAYYSPTFDSITLPLAEQWHDADGAWSTALHELTHWTGHESRLAREFGKRFGNEAYAVEELTAELGAAMMLARIGRHAEPRPDHAQYLASWVRVLKSDATALFTVAAKSERAVEFVLSQLDTSVNLAA